jgi:integrase
MNAAVEDQLIENNPAQRLGRFVKSEKATREAASLTPNEVGRLLQAARNDLGLADYALIFTAVRAGLREGEIAALKWGDVQFGDREDDADRYILVQSNYDRRWSRKMLTPKSRKPRRVDTSRELRRALLQLRDDRLVKAFAKGKSDISDDLVFPSEAGTPIEMNNFSERVFKPCSRGPSSGESAFTIFATPLGACSSRPELRLLTCGIRWGTAQSR